MTLLPRRSVLPLFGLALLGLGCGGSNANAPASGTAKNAGGKPTAPPPSNADIAKRIRENDARRDQMGSSDNSDLTLENNLKRTILYLQGKQGLNPGMPPLPAASETIAALRDGGIKIQLNGVQGQDVQNLAHFLVLKDNSTELMTTTRDMKKRSAVSQLNVRIVRLRQQIDALQNFAGGANFNVQTTAVLTPLAKTASMISVRKRYGMTIDDADYARVKKLLETERRKEAVAAAGLGLLAATQGAINNGTDPTAIDKLGDKLLEAIPMKVEVSDKEARDYVDNFRESVATVKSTYEDIMRRTLGEAYERGTMKGQVNAMFAQIERADQTPLRDDSASADSGSASPANGNGAGGGSAGAGANGAIDTAVAKGTDAARRAIPGLDVVETSILGVQAVQKGDAKGALNAAMKLAAAVAPSLPVAGPIIQAGLGIVGKLFG